MITARCVEGVLAFLPWMNATLLWIVMGLVWGVVFFAGAGCAVAITGYTERKVACFIQNRLGPMEVGPGDYRDAKRLPLHLLPLGLAALAEPLLKALGFLLSLVLAPFTRRIGMPPGWYGLGTIPGDGIKLLAKEDIVPEEGDPALFRFAPYLCFMATLGALAVIPFGKGLAAANPGAGVLWLLAASSLGVIGLVLAGYSSNNKWSLYGAMRSVAQVISYEVPMGLALLSVVMAAGSLDLADIAAAQSGWFWNWNIIANPFLLMAGIAYGIAALAETNRTPFDLPEAESELVSGFNTEYSGMRYAFLLLAEYANLWVVSLVGALFFFGGFHSGIAFLDRYTFLGPLILLAKAYFFVFFAVCLRWTLPRYRVDRLMTMCWKGLLPLTLIAFLGSGLVTAQFAFSTNPLIWKIVWLLPVIFLLVLFALAVREGLRPMPRRNLKEGAA